jgi:hypothetical protein
MISKLFPPGQWKHRNLWIAIALYWTVAISN